MPEPYVREIGKAEDSTDETWLTIGVDYDTVDIGGYRFSGEHLEQFAQTFVAACWAAGYNKRRMEEEARDA
jgi:hypothetical protein